MKRYSQILIRAAVLALGLSAAAYAHEPERGEAGREHGHGDMHELMNTPEGQALMQARLDQRVAELREALALKPEQQSAWQSFETSFRGHLQAMQEQRQARRAAAARPSLPERLEKHLAAMKSMLPRAEQMLAELKAFYGQLSPEQQQAFDEHAHLPFVGGGRHHR